MGVSWEIRYVYEILVGKPEVKTPLVKPVIREDNMKTDLKNRGDRVKCIHLAQESSLW
jgi:hypothetical protein